MCKMVSGRGSFIAGFVTRPLASEYRVMRHRQSTPINALFSPSMSLSIQQLTGGTAFGIGRCIRACSATAPFEHAPETAQKSSRAPFAMVVSVGVRRSVGRLERALAHARHEARAAPAPAARHPPRPPLSGVCFRSGCHSNQWPLNDLPCANCSETSRFVPVASGYVLMNFTKVYFHQRHESQPYTALSWLR